MKTIFRNKKALIGIGILFALMLVFAFLIQQNNSQKKNTYETEVASIGDISTSVEATGRVRAYQSAIYVWKTSGIIDTVQVKLGDSVQKGTELAALQKTSLPAEILRAEADLVYAKQALEDLLGSSGTEAANASIALSDAQTAYDDAVRYRELLDSKVEYDVFAGFKQLVTPFGTFRIPNIENIQYYPNDEQKAEADQDIAMQKALLEDAQRAYDRIKNGPEKRDVDAAEAKVLAAQTTLDQAKIFATFDGTITELDANVGDEVDAGQQAFRIDDLSSLLIDLNVSEIDINSVSPGQLVTVNFDAITSKAYHGEVTDIAVAGSSSANGTGYAVTVKLIDTDESIKQGMTASIFIQIREVKNALLIPNQAIRMLDGERVVYLLRGENDLVPASIRLGARSAFYSEVVSGNIQEGDLVVLNAPSSPLE